jgi:hypothetical protein
MPKQTPSLDELIEAVRTLPIEARFLEDDERPNKIKILGLCEFGEGDGITVNEPAVLVEALLHEALHAIRPNWAEKTVEVRANNIFVQLTSDEIIGFYKQYVRRVRRVRRKRVVERGECDER